MKQRLLLVLLALFTSIGWMNAKVVLTIDKGTKGTLTFQKATGENKAAISINGKEQKGTSYTLTGEEGTEITITGALATLTVNAKVTNVTVSEASDLTSLVFSNSVGSVIKSFTLDDSGKLKTLTAENCGLTTLPINLNNALSSDGASVNLKNNSLTEVGALKDIKGISYSFDGNKIFSWPKLNNATIVYGKQTNTVNLGTTKANAWLDVYGALNEQISNFLKSNKIPTSDLTITWEGGSFESATSSDRLSYRFWDTSKKQYVNGTFTGTAKIKNGPEYPIKATVEKAEMPLTIKTSKGGSFTITNGSSTVSNGNSVNEGDQLFLNAKANSGYTFDKFELKGLVETGTKNVYKVKIERDANGYDLLSAAAIFKANAYTVTVKATGSDNGSFKIINTSDSDKEFTTTTNVAYNSNLKIEAIAKEGYVARVKVDGVEKTLDNNNICFVTIKKNSTIEIAFEKEATALLKIKEVNNVSIAVNGSPIQFNGNTYYTNNITIGQSVNITFKAEQVKIQNILLNATTNYEKKVQSDGTIAISFKMTENGATIEVITIDAKAISVKSKTGEETQTYTYDGKEHAFEYLTDPANLGCTVTYSTAATGSDNYLSDIPVKVGEYKVKITRAADDLYAKVEYTNFKVSIVKADPIVTTIPSVTIDKTTLKYSIGTGSVNVPGKWEVVDNNDKVLTEASEAKSDLVTLRFTPTDDSNYNEATVQTQAVYDGKKMDSYTIKYTVPENSGISVVVKNGNNEIKSGGSVINGTSVTFTLTYPTGYNNVYLYEKDKTTAYGAGSYNNGVLTAEINRNLDLIVKYEGKANIVTLNPTFKGTAQDPTYTGAVPTTLYTIADFSFGITVNTDLANIAKLMQITYIDENGNKLSAPVNAGVYKIHMTIPEYVGANTTYQAFDGIVKNVVYTIKKADPSVSAWPEQAIVGVGQKLADAVFIGGSANVEGSFEFVDADENVTPVNGNKYAMKFVPKDKTNYNEVIPATKEEATVLVTDKRILSISSVVNGSIVVKDQDGNKLSDGDVLGSNITSIKVEATPNSGYVLGTITVNNSTISNGGTYKLGTETIVKVNATFVKQYTITLGSAPKGVKIATKPSSNVVVAGGSYTFTLNHVSGDKPTVTGASNISVSTSGSTTTVKVTNIQANATLAIALANPTAIKITTKPTLSKAGKPMGTIRVTGVNSSNECYYGDKITVTATANPGVEFSGWEDMTSTENPYEFEATNATYTFQAKYHGVLTGIESVDELNYYGGDGYIFVNCPAQGTLTIISMNGRAQKMSVSGQTRVTVPAGVYGIVLTSGSEVVRDKVVVR